MQPGGGAIVDDSFALKLCSTFAQVGVCLQSKNWQNYHRRSPVIAAQRREFLS